MKLQSLLAALCLLVVQQPASAAFSRLGILGDSLSDTGRFLAAISGATFGTVAVPDAPYATGRFTNGNVWAEYYAAAHPEVFVGNAAMGGALSGEINGVDNTADVVLGGLPVVGSLIAAAVSGLNTQLPVVPDVTGTNTAFVLWIGANDLFYATSIGFATPSDIVPTSLANIGNAIDHLLGLGATQVFVGNLPDLGLTPDATAEGTVAALSAATSSFNAGLDSLAASRGPQVRVVDIYASFNALMANAAALGFTNTTAACVDDLFDETACGAPDAHVFWDGVHPTTRVHQLVAQTFDAALSAPIPLPASGLLVLPGLALLALRRRRAA